MKGDTFFVDLRHSDNFHHSRILFNVLVYTNTSYFDHENVFVLDSNLFSKASCQYYVYFTTLIDVHNSL